MLYVFYLKKNTNIGKILYAKSFLSLVTILLILLFVLIFAGISLYSFITDSGYPQFVNDMQDNIAAQLTLTGKCLTPLAEDTHSAKTYCMYTDGTNSAIVLVKSSQLTAELAPYIRSSSQSPESPLTLCGFVRKQHEPFRDAVSTLSRLYGSVLLDVTVKVYPPLFTAALGCTLLCTNFFFIGYVILSVKDIRIYRAMLAMEGMNKSLLPKLEEQVLSHTNVAVGKTILTDDFCINVKRGDLFHIHSIERIYMEARFCWGKPKKKWLIANMTDGSRRIVTADKCKSGKRCNADILAELILERADIPVVGYYK